MLLDLCFLSSCYSVVYYSGELAAGGAGGGNVSAKNLEGWR